MAKSEQGQSVVESLLVLMIFSTFILAILTSVLNVVAKIWIEQAAYELAVCRSYLPKPNCELEALQTVTDVFPFAKNTVIRSGGHFDRNWGEISTSLLNVKLRNRQNVRIK
ncbi:MAG: hypothetical protein KDD25_08195 [Bdellovibrionales bacterium]|nr:hypothetical protein [Bdellovibrionales bacterium]